MILYYCHCGVFSLKRHVIAYEHRESLMLATLGTMEGTFSRNKYDLLWSYACHEMSLCHTVIRNKDVFEQTKVLTRY